MLVSARGGIRDPGCQCGQPHLALFPNSGCDICQKISTDGGTTWGALQTIVKNSSQPSPVYDEATSTVFMNFNGAPHCLGQSGSCGFNLAMSSPNEGETWTTPRSIDQYLGDKGHAAAGPGRGLRLTSAPHQGRMLFIGHRGAYVQDTVWFTDDGGSTYITSATVLEKMDEAQLVENADGLVIANMRHKEI